VGESGSTIPAFVKAKPPADATAFCVLSLPYIILGVVAFAIGLLIYLLLLTPLA